MRDQQDSRSEFVAGFAAFCLAAASAMHYEHWVTRNKSGHDALGYFYVNISTAIDNFVEAYLGKTQAELPVPPHASRIIHNPAIVVRAVAAHCQEVRSQFADSEDLQALLDEVAAVCNKTMFLLRLT